MKRLMLASLLALSLLGLSQEKASAFFSLCGKYNCNVNLRWCGTYNFTMPRVYFGVEWAPKPCCQPSTSCMPLPWQAAFPQQNYLALQRNYPNCPEFGGGGYGQGGYVAPNTGAAPGCAGCAMAPQQAMPQTQAPANAMMQAGYHPSYPTQPASYNYATTGSVPYYWYGR